MLTPWLLLLWACPAVPPDDADDSDDTDFVATGVITGVVRQLGPGALVDPTALEVLVDGAPAVVPSASGLYRVELPAGREVEVALAPRAELRTWAPAAVEVSPGAATVVDLVALVPEVLTFDPAAPVALHASSAVELQIGALRRPTGEAPLGPATAHLALIEPGRTSGDGVVGRDALPGEGLTDDERLLSATVALDVALRDADGVELQPVVPVLATVALPEDRCLTEAPPTWWLDEASGRWQPEGRSTVDPASCTLTLELPHLSTWAAGEAEDRVVVQGSVRYANGAHAVGASVTVVGEGYGWSSTVATGPDATWSTWAKAGAPLSASANVWAGGWFYASAPAPVNGLDVVDPTVVDLTVELDPSRGCDPDLSAPTHTFHLTLREATLHHVWALNTATCGTYEPLEVWPFFAADLVLYAYYNLETPELRLDGPYLMDGAQPALVGDWGVQPVRGVSFDTLTTAPAGGYRREHLGLPVDWQFVLPASGSGGVWAVRTRAGLYGKLEISRIAPTGAGFDVDVRWRLQSDGGRVFDP